MSWKPNIINHKQEEIQLRKFKEEELNEEIFKKNNIVKVKAPQFQCPECFNYWTFSRMKTIECCGITYIREG